MAMLEIHGIHKSFGDAHILNGVDLMVNKGDVVAILGPSGSGKTTLLRCINYLETADQGTMRFGDEQYDLSNTDHKLIAQFRRHTGFVFQNYNLFINKTALENVTLGLITAGKIPKKQAEQIGMELLEKVGMKDRASYYPSQLSGGQQQRVAIARALAGNPEIIFFDEPTSALDPEMVEEVLEVMQSLGKEGMTMIIVTHEMGFARTVADRVVFLEDGHIVEENEAEAFFSHPQSERAQLFLSKVMHQ